MAEIHEVIEESLMGGEPIVTPDINGVVEGHGAHDIRQESNDTCVKILWTGGWDSTFRVLYATLVDGKRVDPHYLIDTGRPSTLFELRAISRIRDLLRMCDKQAYARVSNLHITPQNEIPHDPEITNSWKRLRQRMDLATQYDLLARYARSRNLTALELSVQRDDRDDGIYPFLKANVEQTPSGTYRLKHGVAGDEEIFTRFEFPVLDFSKVQMRDIAEKHGFIEILEKSWFCHQPINGRPCGMCNPCVCTIEQGMRYRFTRTALFRHHLVQFVRRSPLSNVKLIRNAYHFIRNSSKS
jgi:7-cyano-7-deazaguanine synthase in queuosine biosynthesis